MPQVELSELQISASQLAELQLLLQRHVPNAQVWAYGSRITGTFTQSGQAFPLDLSRGTVTAAARMCHEAGVKVLLNDSPFTPSLPAELVEASDILLVNEHEMVQLLGIDEPENDDWDGFDWNHALEAMRGFGFEQAIVTLGGDGSVVLDSTSATPIQRIAPVRVNAVDTTGCGDSFMGTVLAGLASGMALSEAAELASYVSAYAATGYGAQASYGNAAQIREAFAK